MNEATTIAPVTDSDHILGPIDAPITLVEYGEFECPHCGRAHHHLKGLRGRLDDLGVRFVYRHFARDEVHPFAVRAAVTAEAAALQGKFWEMHDHLFEHQHQLEYDDLKRHANDVGLDLDRFMTDVRDERVLEVVRAHNLEATQSGVGETPSFFINGTPYEGPYDLDSLVVAISG
jgi:protein-disulfide isomerase